VIEAAGADAIAVAVVDLDFDVCDRPLITTNAAKTSVNAARFISSSFSTVRPASLDGEDYRWDGAEYKERA